MHLIRAGKGDAAGVAAHVAAMIAAEPAVAEAAGLRPIWLTLQALSAQDDASDGDLMLTGRTSPAWVHAATAAAEAGMLQLNRPQGVDIPSSAAVMRQPMALAGSDTDGCSPAISPAEAAAVGASVAGSSQASPDGCSSRSESGCSDAFEDLKHMSAVLQHSISRTGSSGSDGSLWDSDDG